MSEPLPAPRFTLRSLPLPAKWVITLFLLSVGLGYSSAMVQMHFQHTQGDGSPLPGRSDVIEIFAGKKWLTRGDIEKNRPVSKIEKLVMGPIDGPLSSGGSMASAFFHNDKSESKNRYKDAIARRVKEDVDAEREGERALMVLWVNAPEAERAQAFATNRFAPGKAPDRVSPEYIHKDGGFHIKQLFADRCASCHRDGEQAGSFPLVTYEQIAKYAECAPATAIPEGQDGAWCVSDRQISKEKLAQSTHAHLLSFAMLFALTGLAFSFTSYPSLVRLVLGPLVLLAQVADVSCWWLARIDGPGIYFAQAIMATGAVVGLGLGAQILGSVFNMYGRLGKAVLAALFLAALAGGGYLAKTVILPGLEAQKERKEKKDAAAVKTSTPKAEPRVEKTPAADSQSLEKLLTGKWETAPFGLDKEKKRVMEGGMLRAFFDKGDDTEFKDALKARKKEPQAFTALEAQREAERNVILTWIRSNPADRKKTFEKDEFPLPPAMQGKPMTAEFLANDRAVKVRSIIDTRCYSCHGAGTKVELDSYDKLEKYMK